MSFVIFGFFIQSEMVTKVDAAIGRMFMGDLKVKNPRVHPHKINRIGQIILSAHLFFSRLTNISSLKIPIKFGITPPNAPKRE